MNDLRNNLPGIRGRRRRSNILRQNTRIRSFANSNRERLDVFLTNGLTINQVINSLSNNLLNNIINGQQFLLKAGNRTYTLSSNFIENLQDSIDGQMIDVNNPSGSNEEFLADIYNIGSLSVIRLPEDNNERVGGAFFKYLNNTDMNLEELAIYKSIDEKNYDDNCLTYALIQGGLNEKKANRLRTICQQLHIPISKISEICNKLQIKIKLKKIKKNNKDDKLRYFPTKDYKNNTNEEYSLCCYDEHYFINKKFNYSKFHIMKIVDGTLNKNINDYKVNKNKLNSYNLVKLLLEHKEILLKNINFDFKLLKTIHHEKIDTIKDLTFEDDNFKDCYEEYIKSSKKKKENKKHKVFFDFETYRGSDDINRPYLCCYIDEKNVKKTFYGEDCGIKLLNSIPDNSLLIAHNASFDINFLIHYLYEINIIKKGRKIISVKAKYNNKNISIKDSYLLISMPLRNFGKCFNLEQGKEVMAYRVYDKYFNEKTENKYYPIKYFVDELNDNNKEKIFLENCEKWKLLNNEKDKFNIIQYSAIYCMIDCQVLMDGYNTFRKWILELDFDIDNILTLASLADQYFIKNKCYNDIYSMSGIAREFIQRTVVGGRTMVCKNKRYKLKNCKLADFDAVSLYPSAMKRLQTELGGYLKGKPKILEDLSYDFLKKQDGYFVEIKITDLRIYRDFPLMSCIENGVRNFKNEMVGKILYMDKISLEDAILYHDIDFEIIKGYYYNEGRNPIIGEEIENIFNERLKKKKEKNPAQLVYKLLMNSSYGKTILKPITEEIISFVSDQKSNAYDKLMKYIALNYKEVKSFEKINENHYFLLKNKSIMEHFSRPHIGTEILSMSKRIMNQVMVTAEDNQLQIYYQDTDSMHILINDVYKLEKIFNEKYGRELIGKQLGQFHVDFSLEGVKDESTIYSKNAIFLGKKFYIDELVGKDENGNDVNGYHIRGKGITNGAILYECEKLKINPFELYEKLFEGERIEFDLLEGGNKINLTFNNFVVKNNTKFTRCVQFV